MSQRTSAPKSASTKSEKSQRRERVVICFAGDSGDGMQLTGSQFTSTAAVLGNPAWAPGVKAVNELGDLVIIAANILGIPLPAGAAKSGNVDLENC